MELCDVTRDGSVRDVYQCVETDSAANNSLEETFKIVHR